MVASMVWMMVVTKVALTVD
jgi:hypothetical protein